MRKKLLLIIFMSVLLSPMLGTPSAVTAANSGATLVMGTTNSVMTTIDPAEAWDFFGWEIILNTGCGLIETKPGTSDIMPALATNWSLSGDGLSWTFYLRSGVRFDDGTEFNATHVKYSFDRSMGIAWPGGFQVGIVMDIIKNVTVISKYVVQFNLKKLFSPLLSLMACPALFIVNPNYAPFDQIVNYTEGDARASSPMDLGPYILTNWTRVSGKDQEMWLEANPNYWRPGYPKTEKTIIKFYPNATALRQAIESGDIDVAFRYIAAADIEDLKANPNVKVWQGRGGFIQYMIFQEEMPPLNDSRVRRAITAALDRPGLCETVFLNQSEPLYSIVPIGVMGHTEAFKTLGDVNYTYTQNMLNDPTIYGGPYNATNKLEIDLWFEASGYYPSSPDQAMFYKSSLEASGVISVTLHSVDMPTYRVYRNEGTMQVFTLGWWPDYIDPDDYAFLYWASWINHHYAKYNATNLCFNMTAAYDAARATTNETERIELYAEIDNYAVMDCPVIPLWQGSAWAVTKPNVEGVYLDAREILRMWYLYTAAVVRVPEDYPTIQAAIDAAIPGTTISIAVGTYNETLIINKTLTLLGRKGSSPTFKGGGSGIAITLLPGASGSIVAGITITSWNQGILVVGSSDCKIYDNAFQQNSIAINLTQSSTSTIIYENTMSQNNIGVALSNSSGNIIYHNNFANNISQVTISNSAGNIWDNGYPSGGNYWSNYTDVDLYNGPYQNLTGSDGIWDHPYVIDGNNKDNYPLVNPWTPPTPVGGIYIPVNKIELLAPYIGLTILLAAAVITIGYVKKRKRNTEINS